MNIIEFKKETKQNRPPIKNLMSEYKNAIKDRTYKWEKAHLYFENTGKGNDKLEEDYFLAISKEMELFHQIMLYVGINEVIEPFIPQDALGYLKSAFPKFKDDFYKYKNSQLPTT